MAEKRYRFEEVLEEDGFLTFTNSGVSMLPLLRQGRDLIVIRKKEPGQRFQKLDAVFFRRDNGEYILHRIMKVLPDGYWIVGDNCVSGEAVREEQVLGILVSVRRGNREIDFSSPAYQIYLHLWCAPYRLRFILLRAKLRAGRFCRRAIHFVKKRMGK